MNRRETRNLIAALKALAAGASVIVLMMLAMYWFETVDCNNARNGLAFIERCELSPDCALSANELRLKRVYTRLEMHNCPAPVPMPPTNLRAN